MMTLRQILVMAVIAAIFIAIGTSYADVLYDLPDKHSLLDNPGNAADVWYDSLTEAQLAKDWSNDDGDWLATMTPLAKFDVQIKIDVKLVGFQGDGNMRLNIAPADIMRFIEASSAGHASPFHVLRASDGNGSHALPLYSQPVYHVLHASSKLNTQIATSLRAYIAAAVPSSIPGEPATAHVPYYVIDDILRDDYLATSLSYTIYILNPILQTSQYGAVRYMYSQPVQPTVKSDGTAAPRLPTCRVVHWIGRERYAWIDISAGPISFGPQTSGDGVVTQFSLPHLANIIRADRRSSSSSRPADIMNSAAGHQLMASIAHTIGKTTRSLITPSIDRFPVPYRRNILINMVIVHDREHAFTAQQERAPWNLDIEAQLRSLALVGQTIDIETFHMSFAECELCVAAYTHSLKTHISNVVSDGLRSELRQYLDASEMHDWLEHFDSNYWGIKANSASGVSSDGTQRIIVVFVYDLASPDLILLDRLHQAVSFEDVVLAVETRAPPAVVDYSCNGESMEFDPCDASRAVMASLLQTLWGVSPPQMNWNGQASDIAASGSGALDIDYLWTIGHSPFGYFSHSSLLSFAIRDAAQRHVVYSEINETLSSLSDLLHHFSHYSKQMDEVSTPLEHLHLVRRRNILLWKIQRVGHFLSLNSYNQSLYYIRSAAHDVAAVHELVHLAMARLQPSIWCGSKQEKLEAQSSHWFIIMAHILQVILLLLCISLAAIWSCLPKGSDKILSLFSNRFTKSNKQW